MKQYLTLSPPIITYYGCKKLDSKYTLQKNKNLKNHSKTIYLPPELNPKYSKIDFEFLTNQLCGKTISNFTNTIINKFSPNDLINFYNNINEININSENFKLKNFIFHDSTVGSYSAKKNSIKIQETNDPSTVYHELFHLASSIFKNNVIYSGFRQLAFEKKTSIGVGINEGYTEILTDRYFRQKSEKDHQLSDSYYNSINFPGTYKDQVFITHKLEKIVGQQKMESFYLNANLQGLIKELKKYNSEEEIIKFISNVDFIHHHKNDKNISTETITQITSNISDFLITTYTEKIKQQLNNKLITTTEAQSNLSSYLQSLFSDFIYHNKKLYPYTDYKKAKKFLQSFDKYIYYSEKETFISNKLEQIIGQSKIQNLSTSIKSPEIINELKKYTTEEEILKFISNIETLNNEKNNSDSVPIQTTNNNNNEIGNFLTNIYIQKIKQQLNNNLITTTEAQNNLSSYLKNINSTSFSLLTNNEIKNHLQSFNNYIYSFEKEIFISNKLEQIIEPNNIKSPEIITELKKYTSEEKTLTFINNINFLHNHIYEEIPSVTPEAIAQSTNYIGLFLINTYTQKIKQQIDNNLINQETAQDYIQQYIHSFDFKRIRYANNSFGFINSEQKKDFFNFLPNYLNQSSNNLNHHPKR